MQPIVEECLQQQNSLRNRELVNDAIDMLVESGFFTRDKFDAVHIFFCSNLESSSRFSFFGVSNEFAGLAYVDTILIVEEYIRDASFKYFSSLLAHELFSWYQSVPWVGAQPICMSVYINEIVSGKGSGRNNSIEDPAYAFGDNILARLTNNQEDCQEP